jgi:hypothetical protein
MKNKKQFKKGKKKRKDWKKHEKRSSIVLTDLDWDVLVP